MIMRHWMGCPLTTYGRLREWRIFSRRKGDAPNADTGEVCFDLDCYGRAVVIPGVTTEPACYADENLVSSLCVASGEGVVDAYQRTDIAIHGVNQAIQPIQELLAALKEKGKKQ